ncbi:MAG: DNA polymerase II [Deltaproteobacteria bacterium]|nr:DNA polymerase II [Deltaproteobacteria bacterium]
MTHDGFLLQATYRIEAGRPVVQLWGRLDDGRTFLARETREVPHFWIPARDVAAARALGARLTPSDPASAPRVSFDGEPVARVEVDLPSHVPPLRARLAESGVRCYEADVRFALRPLIDRGIRSRLAIDGEPRARYDEAVEVVRRSRPHLRTVLPAAASRPSVLSFDIETDPRARRLLAVSLHGCGHSEVLLLTPRGYECPESATPARDERELLALFAERVRALDPDVITGWNVIDFDLAVLARLAERAGGRLELGRGPGDVRVRPARGFWDRATASIPGRVVLDGIQLLKSSFVRMESYALGAVAQVVLGETKLIEGSDRAGEILRLFEEDRSRLVAYNLKDARLVIDILARLELLELAVERSLLTGMALDRVGASIASFEFLYLAELARRGVVGPTLASADRDPTESAGADESEPLATAEPAELPLGPAEVAEDAGPADEPSRRGSRASGAAVARDAETMLGGHVLEPRPGLYEFVVVFDFKSLYPSLIRTFQLDPLGFVPPGTEVSDPIVAPNGARFRREPGILPGLLDELFPRRERAKHHGRPLEAQAIKILMNSFYGVLGTSACRFFNPDVANAITAFGRELLLWTKARIESLGHDVVYGDTDSLFVWLSAGREVAELSVAAATRRGEALRARLNADLAAMIAERHSVESKLDLELDTVYRKLLLLPLRHGTGGARKRYAGWVEDAPGGPGHVELTGMEAVRSDWTDLAKRVQLELYQRLFTGEPVERYLREIVDALRAGRFDADLVYRKMLRKDAASYVKTTPPHVAAARATGARPGTVVAYVVTVNGAEPAERRRSALDHEHYVEKQVRPVAEPVLAVLGLDFERAVGAQLELMLGGAPSPGRPRARPRR